MTNFLYWALGIIVGYFGGIFGCLIWNIYTERRIKQINKNNNETKTEFLKAQTELMKKRANK